MVGYKFGTFYTRLFWYYVGNHRQA